MARKIIFIMAVLEIILAIIGYALVGKLVTEETLPGFINSFKHLDNQDIGPLIILIIILISPILPIISIMKLRNKKYQKTNWLLFLNIVELGLLIFFDLMLSATY